MTSTDARRFTDAVVNGADAAAAGEDGARSR